MFMYFYCRANNPPRKHIELFHFTFPPFTSPLLL
jgi:hypothetical protein